MTEPLQQGNKAAVSTPIGLRTDLKGIYLAVEEMVMRLESIRVRLKDNQANLKNKECQLITNRVHCKVITMGTSE